MYLSKYNLTILFILIMRRRTINKKDVPFGSSVCVAHQSRRRRLSAASGFSLLRAALDAFKFFFSKLIVVVAREPVFVLLPVFLCSIFLLLLLGPVGIYGQSVFPVPDNTAVLLRLCQRIHVPNVLYQSMAARLLLQEHYDP